MDSAGFEEELRKLEEKIRVYKEKQRLGL